MLYPLTNGEQQVFEAILFDANSNLLSAKFKKSDTPTSAAVDFIFSYDAQNQLISRSASVVPGGESFQFSGTTQQVFVDDDLRCRIRML